MQKTEWRNIINNRLIPECGCYYIVYDPDYLLGDEKLYIQLKEKGFEILTYTNEIDFRLLFEEKIRSYTDSAARKELKELIIVVHERKDQTYLPYDLTAKSTHVTIDLTKLFPTIISDTLTDTLKGLPVTLPDEPDGVGKTDVQSLKKKLTRLSAAHPDTYTEWLTFMGQWAAVAALIYTGFHPSTNKDLFSLLFKTKMMINSRFQQWLDKSYGSLYNHPPSSPVMVHHIPRYLLQHVLRGRRIALLVIDGLSMSQWKVIKETLPSPTHTGHGYSFEEKGLFAWIPTLTSVSRQALLSGKLPLSISRFLHDTSREEKLWKNFWEDNGVAPEKVMYKKLQGDSRELEEIRELTDHPFQAAAIIVDKIDSIMHGQKQGSSMMHKEVKHWADSAFLSNLLDILFHHYDDVVLTADHGNDEAVGVGAFSQGALIKEKGQRCRVYNSPRFRSEANEVYGEAIPWPGIGLPENYYPLLAPWGQAFAKKDAKVVTHGGGSLDEVIVPFIHFAGEKVNKKEGRNG